ncbi:MAG TPA: GDSL-type esterase/lipase family protein [Rhizomicrobium sp.]|jgi:lysophospholipase L1-like esterase|nr:GDSL-type esterase/lipase family protein [Rhizomicrobium sp.]
MNRHILAGLALAPLLLLGSLGVSRADDASDKQTFHDFLVQAKSNASADKDKVTAFYHTTGAYWRAHWLDYSHHPENYADVMALYHADQALYPRPFVAPDSQRWEKDIQAFRDFDARNAVPKNPALFVGSSTIVKWKTADAFPGFSVINRGFGGNIIEDVLYYYKDVIGKYHPSAVLFYCDNDVTGGDSGDHAFELTMQVYSKVRADFPKVPFVFLSMKHAPNSAFANLGEAAQIDRFNDLAKAQAKKDPGFEYFDMDAPVRGPDGKVSGDLFLDGEHFNDKGYALINPAMEKELIALHVPHSK